MSQHDTGMGWSADSDWLKSGAQARIGSLSIGQIISENAPGIEWGSGAPTNEIVQHYDYYFSSSAGAAYLLCYKSDGVPDSCAMAAYSAVDGVHVVVMKNELPLSAFSIRRYCPTPDTAGSSNVAPTDFVLNPATGLYEFDFLMLSGDSGATSGTIPAYASAADREAAYATEPRTFFKKEFGYAVACFATWITPEGTHLLAPVLISTLPAAAIITEDGTTPATGSTEFDFLYDGVRFYMTIVGGINADRAYIRDTAVEVAHLEQFAAAAPAKVFNLIANSSFSNIVILDSPDPYEDETDPSGSDGGDGEDQDDDPVEEETLPIPSVSGLGFSTIYVPTAADLHSLAGYLWSGGLNLDTFLKLFANPMDSILGLSAVPVSLPGTYEPIYLGGQLLQGVTMPRYTGRTAVKVDMGTVTISERWGAYLDYDPYTEFSIYLPFVGIKNIKADDIMGKTVSLMYNIDILSGACVAYLRPVGGSVLYEWAGQCAMQIPITGNNWDNIFSTAISTAVALGGAMAAPASAPMLAGSVASAAVQAVAAKPRVERSGAVTGVTGFLGQLRPYIIRTIPNAYIPADQNRFIGYPAYINVDLAAVTGYNVVDSIHLEDVPATGAELEEIESILRGGVIF